MIYNRTLPEPEVILSGCYLAGGAILSIVTKTPISDYDIYPKSQKDILDICLQIKNIYGGFLVNKSDRALTFKLNNVKNSSNERMIAQVILLDDFDTVDKIFDKFDFTVCMGAYDCDTKKYYFHDSFFLDLSSKTLNVNVNTNFPFATQTRIAKYENKGFYITQAERLKVAMAIAKKGFPENWEDLESSIGGFYGKKVCVDKEKDFTFENVIETLSNLNYNLELSEDTSLTKKFYKILDSEIEPFLFAFLNMPCDKKLESVILANKKSILAIDGVFTDRIKQEKTAYTTFINYSLAGIPPINTYKCSIFENSELPEVVYNISGFVVSYDDDYLCLEGANCYFHKLNFAEENKPNTNYIFFKELADFNLLKEKQPDIFKDKHLVFMKANITSDNILKIHNNDVYIVSRMEVVGI